MKVILNIADSDVNDLIDFLCEAYDYTATIYNPNNTMEQIVNPESREQFAKRVVIFPLKQGFDNWLTRRAVKLSNITSSIELESIK